jgi:glucose/arabinose dehydrogenase
MSNSTSVRRGLLVAGSFAFLAAAVLPLAAQPSPAPSNPNIPPMSQGRPGFSPIDQTKVERSKQDFNLKGHPVPPIAMPADKLPLDKIKLPAGFKAEVWSSGHAGARTMVMGDKGTMFMGTRIIGRVYAITEKDGKRESKVLIQGLTQPNGLAFKDGALYVFAIKRQDRGQSRQAPRAGRADQGL